MGSHIPSFGSPLGLAVCYGAGVSLLQLFSCWCPCKALPCLQREQAQDWMAGDEQGAELPCSSTPVPTGAECDPPGPQPPPGPLWWAGSPPVTRGCLWHGLRGGGGKDAGQIASPRISGQPLIRFKQKQKGAWWKAGGGWRAQALLCALHTQARISDSSVGCCWGLSLHWASLSLGEAKVSVTAPPLPAFSFASPFSFSPSLCRGMGETFAFKGRMAL